jgi:hypothetical protein
MVRFALAEICPIETLAEASEENVSQEFAEAFDHVLRPFGPG